MTDRPILFSAPMVRALLDGRKTQTRRIINVEKFAETLAAYDHSGALKEYLPGKLGMEYVHRELGLWDAEINPRGRSGWYVPIRFAVGDRLWVKETHACVGDADRWTLYRASGYEAECDRHGFDKPYPAESKIKWKPSIFMRRALSRLTLTVNNVRIERLKDCSDADALAEGVEMESADPPFYYVPGIWPHSLTAVGVEEPGGRHATRSYAKLWNHINGVGAWEANPWVVAVSFDVRKGNIDG
ncbi:hypothetical protein [Sphingobium sp.]|uniref:hypothetical protein n=1 Tax=Sphingobium sp. TaxID=1912891 RepID=UPI0035C73F5E